MNQVSTKTIPDLTCEVAGSANARALTVRQVSSTFGAKVEGMPIHGDVSPELLVEFVSLLHRYRVLIVPENQVMHEALVAFSRRLGPLEIHSRVENTVPSHPEIFCVGNVDPAYAASSANLSSR